MIRNWLLVLSGLAFCAITGTKGDTMPLQKTVENLVNYTVLEALEELDLDDIANTLVDVAYKNYSKHGKVPIANYILTIYLASCSKLHAIH